MSIDLENNAEYLYIDNDDKLKRYISIVQDSKIMAVDVETTGLDSIKEKIRLLQLAVPDKPSLIIDMWKISNDVHSLIRKVLSNSSIKVLQNAKFDLKFLTKAGMPIKGQLFDTYIGARLLESFDRLEKYSLDSLVWHYLKINLSKEQQRSDWSKELSPLQLEYAAKDVLILLSLREALIKRLKEERLIEIAKIEFDCIYAVAEMELNGVLFDKEKCEKLNNQLEKIRDKHAEYLKECFRGTVQQISIFGYKDINEINLDSHKQVLKCLNNLGINVKNTSKDELANLSREYPVVQTLIEYRKAAKLIQNFTVSLIEQINPITGRIHSNYYQMGTSTGRFSCGNPNLQQIPRDKRFRDCFTASENCKLVIADYSQIELRVIAEISRDETMIKAFRNNQDLHRLTASLLLSKPFDKVTKEERQSAKAVNFGLVYAMGAKGLRAYSLTNYGVEITEKQAETFKNKFFQVYKGVAKWHESVKKRNSKESCTLCGRRVLWKENLGAAALNTPVQGTAADIVKNALGMLIKELEGTEAKIIGTVHDEIILEVPEEKAERTADILKCTMEKAGEKYMKQVHLIAEVFIGSSWAEK